MATKLVVIPAIDGSAIPLVYYANQDGTYALKSAVAPSAFRNAGVLHRSAVAAVDKLSVPGTLTLTAITEAGSTLANVAYTAGVSAGNAWGPTGPGTLPGAITPTALQAVRMAWAQVTGATYYDQFLSVDAAPKWIGRVTEAQRASGGFIISTVGTVTAGSSAAGSIDIGIPGTGLQTNVSPFTANNAYTPATPSPINCTGFSRLHVHAKMALTDLRSLPTLTIIPFFQDQVSTSDWFAGKAQAVSLLTAVGQCLEQDFEIDVDGATNVVLLVDTISGQGAAVSLWVELA